MTSNVVTGGVVEQQTLHRAIVLLTAQRSNGSVGCRVRCNVFESTEKIAHVNSHQYPRLVSILRQRKICIPVWPLEHIQNSVTIWPAGKVQQSTGVVVFQPELLLSQ